MNDVIGALRTNLLLLIVNSGLAVATCLIALLILAFLARITRRARTRMTQQHYALDSDDFIRVTRAFGWFASLRDAAWWLIVMLVAFGMEPLIPAISLAAPAALAAVLSLIRHAPYRSWEAAPADGSAAEVEGLAA